MSDCARCKIRGKPVSFGSEPECAFPEGVFSKSNWQCATMNELRNKVEDGDEYLTLGSLRVNDQSAALLADDSGQYIVMSWYKNRGRTEGAWLMSETTIEPLTLKDAERFLGDKEIISPHV